MGSIRLSRIRQRMRLWSGAEGHGMSGRLLLSSPKPHVPSLTPYGCGNDTPALGFQAADRSEELTFLHRWKTESTSKRMRLKRGSLTSPRLPCSGWISKRPRDILLFLLLTKLWFSQVPFAAKGAQFPQGVTLPHLLHSQTPKCLKWASYCCPSLPEEKMSKSCVNKRTFFLHTTPTWSSLSPEALLLGQNLWYTISLLRKLGKLGLLSKDLDYSSENYGGGAWHVSLSTRHATPLGCG